MSGYTDLPFRLAVREVGGPGLAVTEMLNPRSILAGTARKIHQLLATDPDDRPLAYQLYGHEPEVMAEAAKWLEAHGAAIIDINMGCPQRKIVRRGAGAALLKSPEIAVAIARRVVESVKVPVTAKIRTGWNDTCLAAPTLAAELEQAGIAAVTVHARTACQRFAGSADWTAIRLVVEAVSNIPVIGNGDVVSARAALDLLEQTGCAGVMIGRYALAHPWIFRDVSAALQGLTPPDPPSRSEHLRFMSRHLERMAGVYGERAGARMFRRWIPQYAKALRIERREMIRLIGLDDFRLLAETVPAL